MIYFCCFLLWFVMNQSGFRDWKVLCWNVRGLNSEARQLAVKQKIDESGCSVVCLQETKCMHIDHRFIRKFCPRRFDNFAYVPSVGASAGMVVIWNSSFFEGKLIEAKPFGIIVEFLSKHTSEVWKLVTVYGPCHSPTLMSSCSGYIIWTLIVMTNGFFWEILTL